MSAQLIVALSKRLLETDRAAEPWLFDDRLNDLSVAVWEHENIPACPICGSPETVELHDEKQSITVCAVCGYDGP